MTLSYIFNISVLMDLIIAEVREVEDTVRTVVWTKRYGITYWAIPL